MAVIQLEFEPYSSWYKLFMSSGRSSSPASPQLQHSAKNTKSAKQLRLRFGTTPSVSVPSIANTYTTLKVPWHATLRMLIYRCEWALNTVFEDVQEIQPWCRITATTSQSHNELSTNLFLEAGQGGGWGCGSEQLAARVPCAHVYSGCIAMARCRHPLAVFCKYSRIVWVLRRESWSSTSK